MRLSCRLHQPPSARKASLRTPSKFPIRQPRRQSPSHTAQDSKAPSIGSTAKAPIRAKPLFYAIAVSTIAIAGTLWGATLKKEWQMQKDRSEALDLSGNAGWNATKDTVAQADDEIAIRKKTDKQHQEQLEVLMDRRARLVTVREELARKIEDLTARQEERDRASFRKAGVEESAKRHSDG